MAAASWGIVMMLLQKERTGRANLQAGPIAQAPPAE